MKSSSRDPSATCGCRATPCRGNACPRRERPAVCRHRVEEGQRRLARRIGRGQQGRPDDVDTIARVDGKRRPVLGTAVEHPVVFADARGRREGAAVRRPRECDVPDVAGVDLPPRRVDPAVRAGGKRRLAAVADAARNRLGTGLSVDAREQNLRPLRTRDGVGLALRAHRVLMIRAHRHRVAARRELAVIQPDGDDMPVAVGRDRLPAAISGGLAARHRHRRSRTSCRRRRIATRRASCRRATSTSTRRRRRAPVPLSARVRSRGAAHRTGSPASRSHEPAPRTNGRRHGSPPCRHQWRLQRSSRPRPSATSEPSAVTDGYAFERARHGDVDPVVAGAAQGRRGQQHQRGENPWTDAGAEAPAYCGGHSLVVASVSCGLKACATDIRTSGARRAGWCADRRRR